MPKNVSPEQVKEIQEKLKNMSPEELKSFVAQQCLFCQISSGKIPSRKIYEDDDVIAILDINPAADGHTLLIPKEHYQIIGQIPDDFLGHIFVVANKLGLVIAETLQATGYNVFVANGASAGQNAPHAIIHIIPRNENDDVGLMWQAHKGDEQKLDSVFDNLASKLKGLIIKKEQPKQIVYRKEESKEEKKVEKKKRETERKRIP
ncbi:MAG: HIT family protein [Candidatus Woesearchaeota archaeon]|nr:MAG: HIT family protein [Candidatus Woesearchaeota archaeon]